MDTYHDLHFHHSDSVSTIWNVDPDRYSHIDLSEDCYKALTDFYGIVGLAPKIHYELPNSKLRMLVSSDADVLDMFSFHVSKRDINLFVEVETPVSVDLGERENDQFEDEEENVEVDNNNEGGSNQTHYEQDEVDKNSEGEDYVYGFSSEDEDWNEGGSQSESSSNDETLMDERTTGNNSYLNRSDDGLSDYESNDDCGYSSSNEWDEEDEVDEIEEGYYGNTRRKASNKRRPTFRMSDYSKYGKEFRRVEGAKIELEQYHLFDNVDHFREVLKDYAIQEGFRLWRLKNEKTRVTCRCRTPGCPWRIHASPLPDNVTYMIKTLDDRHDCVRFTDTDNPEADSSWIAKKYVDRFKENPDLTVKGLKGALRSNHGLQPKRMKLYRAKRKAMDEVEGSHSVCYKLLPQYANEIRKTNPGSLVKFNHWQPDFTVNPAFRRIFISFEAMRTGFNLGCRPFLGLDGCHLKGPYGGVLLAAIALDANNGLFPVAFAVVESERKDSWVFFLQHLSTVIEADTLSKHWTIMSDMQKGLDEAIVETIPQATHRLCCKHLYNAFKKKHGGFMLRKIFWKAARAYNSYNFEEAMDQMRNLDPAAHEWLMTNFQKSAWSRHAFNPSVRNDHVTNNITESFNNWVGDLRMMPILSCLDGIRVKLMERLQKRYQVGCSWNGVVTPNIRKQLNKVTAEGRKYNVRVAGGGVFEVMDESFRHIINLNDRTCDCNGWQISGLPCKHAAAAICHTRDNIETYCDSCYTIETYMKTYQGMIYPIPDPKLWEPYTGIPLDPPPPRRLPGRPRKNRRRDVDEAAPGTSMCRRSFTLACTLCKRFGHNRRTCQRAPTRMEQAQEAGRGLGSAGPSQSQPCVTQQQQYAGRGRGRGTAAPPYSSNAQSGRGAAPPSNAQGRGRGSSAGPANTQGRGRGSSAGPANAQGRGRGSSAGLSNTQGGRGSAFTYGRGRGRGSRTTAAPSNAQRGRNNSSQPTMGRGRFIPVFGQLGARGRGMGGSQNM